MNERLIAALRQNGAKGPLLCMLAQLAQVVISPIPGEITQLAAGYVFGTWRGFVYSIPGILAGSVFNFYLARALGRPTLERFVGAKILDRVDKSMGSAKGKFGLFLLFLLPGAPKDAMCYGAGFTQMGWLEFVIITGLARSPALLASTLIGSRSAQYDAHSVTMIGLAVLLAITAYWFYERHRNAGQVQASRKLSVTAAGESQSFPRTHK